jgi:hypothetical protein
MSVELLCSCCGSVSWRGKQDPNHDSGYGTCVDCQAWIDERNEQDWNRLRDKVAAALNDKNRAHFLAMEMELQRGIMLKMMDDGLIAWTIGGK